LKYIPSKKAIFKSSDARDFLKSKCIITISVGQPNHEGDKFLATIIAASRQFGSCLIMICDSLQRYTMKILSSLSLLEIHQESNILGDKWIDRNFEAIEQLHIPYAISRWDQWITHPNFIAKSKQIETLYQTDPLFKKSVDSTSHNFTERKLDTAIVDKQTAMDLSRAYLLEECAVMLLQADEGYHFEIYPSQRNDAMAYVYENIISYTNNRDLMRAVSIKFKNLNVKTEVSSV
jgi:hypothetical protein